MCLIKKDDFDTYDSEKIVIKNNKNLFLKQK